MTSWPVDLAPEPQPRLAGALALLHALVAVLPWLMRVPPWLALSLSLLAVLALPATLARLPGPHCRLRRLQVDGERWLAWIAGREGPVEARPGPGCRVYPGLLVLDLRSPAGRCGWLLARQSVPGDGFRRLKAWLRLSC